MLNIQNPLFQSPYLYLQTAGSDGSDGSSEGIQLRWDFRRKLRNEHLPKGDLAQSEFPTNIGFNRPGDFVKVYRAPFSEYEYISWDLSADPVDILESPKTRIWVYEVQGFQQAPRSLQVYFSDLATYDQLKNTVGLPPSIPAADFIHQYGGLLEVNIAGNLFFEANFQEMSFDDPTGNIRIESISLPDKFDTSTAHISCRKTFDAALGAPLVKGENLQRIRFSMEGVSVFSVGFALYQDTILSLDQQNAWTHLGDFALTVDDGLAMERLEDPGKYEIHHRWPKFQGADTGTGEFTVNVDNYHDRWMPATNPQDGLKEGITRYLSLSQTDPRAIETLQDDEGVSNSSFSFLDMLRFVSLDYHIARMLGLGHIDAEPYGGNPSERFVYLVEYQTEAELDNGLPNGLRTHYFMSQATSCQDFRLPPSPVLKALDYGLYVRNGSPEPSLISDENGYVPAENGNHDYVRYINLRKELFQYERPMEAFFAKAQEFCLQSESMPVLFGIQYKEESEPEYRKPALLHDGQYFDPSGLAETIPIPENGDPYRPIYAHRETEEGIHGYALYSINWFSRVSPDSNAVLTDETIFPLRNSLLPPSNFAVQLIQEENPRIFTTQDEQTQLTNLAGPDKTMVRATFDWNFIHNIEHQYGDTVEFFFRESPAKSVQGKISQVVELNAREAVLHTADLVITSVVPNDRLHPFIDPADQDRFVGSRIVVDQKAYEVLEVMTVGDFPSLKIRKIRDTDVHNPNNDGNLIITERFVAPEVNSLFMLQENLSDSGNWDFQLNKSISIEQFLPSYTETIVQPDGSQKTIHPGGIFGQATITEFEDRYAANDPAVLADPEQAPFAGDLIPGSQTGVFKLVFPNTSLADHPDPEVNWSKGWVRIEEDASLFPASGDANYRTPVKKTLKVHSIDQLSPLELTVIDTEFDPNSSQSNPLEEYMPIQTGVDVSVNVHPSYQLYLYADTVNGNQFDESMLLPQTGEGQKITYMAVRAKDSVKGLVSALSPAIPLMALEMQVPVAPELPIGPAFATRPNFYGKSTYTFDTKVNTSGGRSPYALLFMRGEKQKILDTLYKAQTVQQILADLENLSEADAAFNQNRWNDLVNVEIDPAQQQFKEYIAGGYRFPLPDNEDYAIPSYDPMLQIHPFDGQNDFDAPNFTQITRQAITSAFISLTEQPVLYKYIQDGYQTSDAAPKFRDTNGDLIFPSDPIDFNQFNPFPMVVKYADGPEQYLRFTDYSIEGAANTSYFYFAIELSNRQEWSDPSPVCGPVQLVNSQPAEAPVIREIQPQVANPILGISAGVKLSVNPYIESENIRSYQLYRSVDAAAASSIRTMTLVDTAEAGEELMDDFGDLAFPPYGDPLFYRVVALRSIVNERMEEEAVPSKASNTALTSIVDLSNPPTPELSIQSDPITTVAPIQIDQVQLSWEKTVHNGTYHLYKMNDRGHWVKIHSLSSNANSLTVNLSDTDLGEPFLSKENEDEQTIYHHFKVVAENASGLMSLKERVRTC